VEEGTTLHVVDADGEVVASYVTSKSIENLVYSGDGIESGATGDGRNRRGSFGWR
jgi:hypothetical protein